MSAMMHARRHPWTVPPKPINYNADGFSYDTEVCACDECDMLRHDCVVIPVCDDCNVSNDTCTQGGITTCFICHTPLEKEAYVLRFCAEGLGAQTL